MKSRAKVLCRRKKSRVICKVRFLSVRYDSWDSNDVVKIATDQSQLTEIVTSRPHGSDRHFFVRTVTLSIYYWTDALQHGNLFVKSHNNLRHFKLSWILQKNAMHKTWLSVLMLPILLLVFVSLLRTDQIYNSKSEQLK